jgi:hypothetical protein
MKLSYLMRRIIAGIVIGIILILVRKATAADITVNCNYFGTYYYNAGELRMRLINPTNAGITYTPGNGSGNLLAGTGGKTWHMRSNSSQSGTNFSTVTVPANSTVTVWVEVQCGHSNGAVIAASDHTITGNLFVTVGGVAKTIPVSLVANLRWQDQPKSWVPNPFHLPDYHLANPPASAKITINADANAAGSRTWQLGANGIPATVTLVQGANVVLNTTSPGDYADGTSVIVKQGSTIIGTGSIAKDSFGNFDTQVTATGQPVSGIIRVVAGPEYAGPGRIKVAGSIDHYFTFDSGPMGEVTSYTFNPALYAEAAPIAVEFQKPNADWATAGTGAIQKDAGGSVDVAIVCYGETPEDYLPTDAVFKLDLASYEPSTVTVALQLGNTLFSPLPVSATGHESKGGRSAHIVKLDNTNGGFNGQSYLWVVNGNIDDVPVTKRVVAQGQTPEGHMGENGVPSGFFQEDVASIGTQQAEGISANDYDPATPPAPDATPEEIAKHAAKKDDYEAGNKAIRDAMNDDGGVQTAALPDDSAGKTLGTAVGKAAVGAFGAGADSGNAMGTGMPVGGTYGTQSTLTITFPVVGSVTIDAANFGNTAAICRTILLMGLCWQYYKVGMQILRDSTA